MNWLSNIDLSALQTALPTVMMVGWLAWHLNGKFHKIEKDLQDILSKHEIQDQTRHIENIERFTKLEIGQARLGLINGYRAPQEENRDSGS